MTIEPVDSWHEAWAVIRKAKTRKIVTPKRTLYFTNKNWDWKFFPIKSLALLGPGGWFDVEVFDPEAKRYRIFGTHKAFIFTEKRMLLAILNGTEDPEFFLAS